MIRLSLLFAMLASPAFAQQQPDPAALQKAVQVLQQQRNMAMDQAATFQIEAQRLAEENAKLVAKIGEMEKKLAPVNPAPEPPKN